MAYQPLRIIWSWTAVIIFYYVDKEAHSFPKVTLPALLEFELAYF